MQTLATMTTIRAWGREAPSPGKRADALRQRAHSLQLALDGCAPKRGTGGSDLLRALALLAVLMSEGFKFLRG